jgi:hypothetical protein
VLLLGLPHTAAATAPSAPMSSNALTPAERTALTPVQDAIAAKDWTAAQHALPTAQAAVTS